MPYILPKMVSIACEILEILDAVESTGHVPAAYLMAELSRGYYEIAPTLNVLRNTGVITGKTGLHGGYKRAKHLSVRELGTIFSVRFLPPDNPPFPTKADIIQVEVLELLDKIKA